MFGRRLNRSTRPQRRSGTTLGRKMALILLPLVVLPILLVLALAYPRLENTLQSQAIGQVESAVQDQIARIEDWTQDREIRIQLISQRANLRQALADLQQNPGSPQALEAIATSLEGSIVFQGEILFSDLVVAEPSTGQVLYATRPDWIGGSIDALAQGDHPFEELSTRPHINEALIGENELAILTSAPIRHPENNQIQAVLIGVNADVRLLSLLSDIQAFWERRGVYQIERGRTFLAIPPDTVVELTVYATEPTIIPMANHPIFELMQSNSGGTFDYQSLDGEAVLGSFVWIEDWDLGLVAEIPRGDVLGDLSELARFFALTVALAILFTMTTVLFATNRLLRPLRDLTEFAERISRGEWLYRVPESRNDELGALAVAFNRMAEDLSSLYRSLEDRVEARTQQIRTAAEVARAVISSPSLADILNRAVNLIRDRFGYYHVSIFLIDDQYEYAVLRASTGEVGSALIARGHRLGLGSESVIGWVTANGQPRVATDVSLDPIHFRNELLPETRSEVAIPLQVAGRVLGALDVQSTEPDAFQPDALEILQTLADQLSAAIQNARLAETSAASADRARLISRITTQLSGVMNTERVLQHTAQSLYNAMGQPEIVVKLVHRRRRGSSEELPEEQAGAEE